MAGPVLLVVGEDEAQRTQLERDLAHRFGNDYTIRSVGRAADAVDLVDELARQGEELAVVFALAHEREDDVSALFGRVRELHSAARRVVLVTYEDLSTNRRLNQAMALGHVDDWLMTPWDPPDVGLHPTVAGLLADWTRETSRPRFEAIRVVGEQWAPRSHRLRDLLQRNGLPYGFYGHDSEEGRALLREAGRHEDGRLPIAVLFDGRVLVEPSDADVAEAFGIRTRPDPGAYDVAVVGAGPAGLSAAVYAASEGLRTLHLESDALGGQAGTTSLIRNYVGFSRGVSGQRLALSASQQSVFFGAVFVYRAATGLRRRGRSHVLELDGGGEVEARAVILATGARYRRLDVPPVEALVGRGVFYGATVTEAKAMTGRRVFVVGAGNSAGQAAVHLARYAEEVTLLVRRDTLRETMSDYLIRSLAELSNLTVRYGTRVIDGRGGATLEELTLTAGAGESREDVAADALFVLIGATPRTEWLPEAILRDSHGYLLTGRDLTLDPRGADASGDRTSLLAETSMSGVFAAGDVRHGSLKRVAAAVGEGSTAVRLVHAYLEELDGAATS